MSQAEMGHTVTVIGQKSTSDDAGKKLVSPKSPSKNPSIIGFKSFSRLSWRRIFSQLIIFRHAFGEKADLYQVHSPELLCLAFFIRILRPGTRIIYDVHEDYFLNIRSGGYYPGWLGKPLSVLVKKMESFLARRCDGIIYAENCFWIKGTESVSSVFILNKFNPDPEPNPASSGFLPQSLLQSPLPFLLYSGTIAKNWGIMETLQLWKKLNNIHKSGEKEGNRVNLVIAGHGQDQKLIQSLPQTAKEWGLSDRFFLLGGSEYLAHSVIHQLIGLCVAGTAFYALKPNLIDRVPTKFYEYMSQGKPLLFSPNPKWIALNAETPFGLAIDPEGISADEKGKVSAEILSRVKEIITGQYRLPKVSESAWSWATEAKKLENFLGDLAS